MNASGGPYDHAGCSVGSYVHGLVPLEAAAGDDAVARFAARETASRA